MSLLEDVFLQDEANEAQELERVIEGGDYKERIASNSDDNSEKEDEAEEDKRRVDPTSTKTKRVIKNPRFLLNPARLTGPRGIQVIPEHFKDFKFKGKGHEKEDLDLVLKRLEHWAYRLYPKFKFEDCLKKMETLGKKRPVMVHLHKIRSDQLLSEETVIQRDSSDDETPAQQEPDEFDKLLQQQIELARATPAPASAKKSLDDSHIENRSLVMPKATSSPSISDEQRERMLRNRRLAEERRLARLNNSNDANNSNKMTEVDDLEAKKRMTNVVDSSDEECANESVTIDIKQKHIKSSDNDDRKINESQQKKRKANIIDSSDEENVTETVTVDVQTHMNERDGSMEMVNSKTDHTQEKEFAKEMENHETDNEKIDEDSSIQDDEISPQARSCKESNELITREVTGSNSKSNILNENVELILENNIIQSTILGLMENDNNLNLERDLINQELNEERPNIEAENAGSSNISEQNTDKNDDIMDLDLSDDF